MKKHTALPWMIGIGGCIVLLFALMLAVVMLTGVTSGTIYEKTPFSLSSLTSGETNTSSCGDAILPAFIGIVCDGEKTGLCAGDSVIEEIYAALSPWIADALAAEPYEATNGPEMRGDMIVVEYHTPLPAHLIGVCAQALSDAQEMDTAYADPSLFAEVSRLFLEVTPGGKYTMLIPAADGGWLRYTCPDNVGEEYPDKQRWLEWKTSFRNHFYRFSFAAECVHTESMADGDSGTDEDPWEIVFAERMRTRGMIVGDKMGVTLRNRTDQTNIFVRLLGYNPDKLSRREEKDGSLTLVENHGIFRLGDSEFVYTANPGGGVELGQIIGYRETYTPADMLRGGCTILETLGSLQPYCVGGDAGITLTGVSYGADGITFTFSYTFDNLRLWNCAPAMTITFSGDYRVCAMTIHTIAVRSIGEYSTLYAENGIRAALGYGSTILVYDADPEAVSIFPEWARMTKKAAEEEN